MILPIKKIINWESFLRLQSSVDIDFEIVYEML